MTLDAKMVREKLGLNIEKTKDVPWKEKRQNLPNDIQAAIDGAGRFNLNSSNLRQLQADLETIRAEPTARPQRG